MSEWELSDGAAERGPYTEPHVLLGIQRGLPPTTLVRRVGESEWRPIRSHAAFAMEFQRRANVPEPTTQQPFVMPDPTKSGSPSNQVDVRRPMEGLEKQEKKSRWPLVLMVFAALFVVFVAGFVVWARREVERGRQSANNDMARARKTIEAAEGLVAAIEFQNNVAAQPTFASAIAYAKPKLTDTIGVRSEGTLGLLNWTTKHVLTWSDVALAKDETSVGLASKNIDSVRGKRLCAQGAIANIEVSQIIGTPYVGLMGTNEGALHFAAVRDTGDLVALSNATFCGVVTGKFNNVVQVVGMFDLPSNHK